MTTAAYEFITLTVEDRVARITLNRPDVRNALTQEMGIELRDAVFAVGARTDVRALILTGGPTAFSSGADLRTPAPKTTASGRPDLAWLLREVYNPLVTALREIPQPVISVLNGPAVGVAVGIALAADLIVASEGGYFLLSFVSIGLAPDGGASALITERAGRARAAQMLMLGERVPATTAAEWGLINEVLPDPEAADARASELAAKLAGGPPISLAATKRMLGGTFADTLAATLEAEAIAQGIQGEGDESVEGIMAFLQKRPANFPDRPA